MKSMTRGHLLVVPFLVPFWLLGSARAVPADPPETVVVTYAPRPGKESEVEGLIRGHFATVTRLRLATGDPHITYRDKDAAGRTIFVDIFTWKSHAAPDGAPPEVAAIWAKMEAAVEKRDGHRGIEIREVERLK
jgi:hypothetical protein